MNTPVHPGAIVREDCLRPLGPVGHRRRKAARHRAPDAFQSRQREGVGFDRDGLSSIEGIRLHPRNVARHAAGPRSCAVSSFGKHDQCRTNCCRVGSSHPPLAAQCLMSRGFTSSVDEAAALATRTASSRAWSRSCRCGRPDHGTRCTQPSSVFLAVPRHR